MLSNVSTLVLGLIAEKPINPYEINKSMKYMNIDNWFSIASSSIYATIRALNKKGYIVGNDVKEGNMPEKTIYRITPEGQAAFIETISDYLLNYDCDYIKLNIVIIFICHFPKKEILLLLNKKVEKLKKRIEHMNLKKEELEKQNVPGVIPYGAQAIIHMIYLAEVTLKTINELIILVGQDESWNHYITDHVK